jgi:hypothetical protein
MARQVSTRTAMPKGKGHTNSHAGRSPRQYAPNNTISGVKIGNSVAMRMAISNGTDWRASQR